MKGGDAPPTPLPQGARRWSRSQLRKNARREHPHINTSDGNYPSSRFPHDSDSEGGANTDPCEHDAEERQRTSSDELLECSAVLAELKAAKGLDLVRCVVGAGGKLRYV